MGDNQIVGTWKLMSYSSADEDGNIGYPLGLNPRGYIMYTADGYMSVSMSTGDRSKRDSNDLMGGTDEEKIAEAETYISYCGEYELYDDRVIHQVEMALFHNRVGTSQIRYYKIVGDRITLTTPPIAIHGTPQVCTIIWDKV